MKPGDLVRGTTSFLSIHGLILCESRRTNEWGTDTYRWWKILDDNGNIVEEVEHYLEVVQTHTPP